MKIIDIEQGTNEWVALRREKIGASNSPALIPGVQPYKTPLDVYNEMNLGKEVTINAAMRRGMELEGVARECFISIIGEQFTPAVCVNEKYPYMMASLDGISEDGKTIVEIKVPGKKKITECLSGQYVPIYWEYQLQHQLLLSEADVGYIFIWSDDGINFSRMYAPSVEIMEKIRHACERFYYDNLCEFKPPKKGHA